MKAAQISIAQLKDAGDHGATASPQFQQTMEGLKATESNLSTALSAQHGTDKLPSETQPAVQADAIDQQKPAVGIDPALLAQLRAAGVTVADPNGAGHGVAAQNAQPSAATGRG